MAIESKTFLQKLISAQGLNETEMEQLMKAIMSSQLTDTEIAAVLVALRMKGESVAELFAAAKVMRELATPIPIRNKACLDIVGTGGDGSNTFNISTAASFIVAAAGGIVAKHGNRSISSKSGSADVLAQAGINIKLTPDQVALCINELGIGFLYAPVHHTAMQQVRAVRKTLGVGTLFNLLGPLTNPAKTKYQLIGVYDQKWLQPFAKVYQRLGSQRSLIVHAEDGLDEISIATASHICELNQGQIKQYTITPDDFGMRQQSLQPLVVHSAEQSLTIINDVFNNVKGPTLDIVLLNSGAAIYAAKISESIAEGIELARSVIAEGKAKAKFLAYIEFSNRFNHEYFGWDNCP